MTPCTYCHGARLVGWSGSGPILCPDCSKGEDAFTVVTAAWREQRFAALDARAENDALKLRVAVLEKALAEATVKTGAGDRERANVVGWLRRMAAEEVVPTHGRDALRHAARELWSLLPQELMALECVEAGLADG